MIANEAMMRAAIKAAIESAQEGDYALGAVIARNNEIIATGKTRLKHEPDPTVHAEIVAIREACKKVNNKYLEDCVLYTTHEPCSMCASAAVWAKMKGIVFGATIEDAYENAKTKAKGKFSWRQINIKCKEVLEKGEPKLELVEGFLREDCKKLFELSQ